MIPIRNIQLRRGTLDRITGLSFLPGEPVVDWTDPAFPGLLIADRFGVARRLVADPGPHTHAIAGISGLQAALDGKAASSHSHAYSSLTGIPSTFAPSAHGHAISEVTGLQAALDGKAAASHQHGSGDITDLAWTKLTGVPSTFLPSAHGHAISEITGLQATLDGKAALSHSHAYSSLTGIPSTFPPAAHTHGNSDLTGLASASVAYAANADTLDGCHASQLQERMSQRDFPNGTLVQTSIPYGTNGSAFLLRITGNSYGAAVPFDTLVQGYIYNDTIINTGGIANGTHFSDLRAIRVGGNLAFWWPRMEYWQGFNVHVQDTLDSAANKVTSITDSALPTTDKMVQFGPSIRASIHSGNIGSQNVNSANLLGGNPYSQAADANTIAQRNAGGSLAMYAAYVYEWVRLGAENTGLYCPSNGSYFYQSTGGGYWVSQSANGFIIKDKVGNNKGRLYFDGDGFGLLNDTGNWGVRCNYGGSIGGSLYGRWLSTGGFDIGTANTSLTQGNSYSGRLSTPYGYIEFGPKNGAWCHIDTDMPKFYFGKNVSIDGWIEHYGGAWSLSVRGSGGQLALKDVSNGLTYALHVEGGNLKLIQV